MVMSASDGSSRPLNIVNGDEPASAWRSGFGSSRSDGECPVRSNLDDRQMTAMGTEHPPEASRGTVRKEPKADGTERLCSIGSAATCP